MQLRELDEWSTKLRAQGVVVHAVSAEPGGADEIKLRLADRDTAVSFPVHSDPDHKLLLCDAGTEGSHSLYVKRDIAASNYGGTYEDYSMVQPAFVVLDKSGAIQQTWSWNTEPLNKVEPKEEMTPVGSMGGSVLVSIRPVTADIGISIAQGRQVQLKGKSMLAIVADMPKSQSWAEFKGHLVRSMSSFGAILASART